jgi:hypothetical protein
MAVNKVEFGDQVVMDITDSTVSPEKLLSGETAYDKSGAKITGSLVTKDITVTPKRNTGENIATVTIDGIDHDIYALSEEEVINLISGEQEATGNPVVLKTLIGGNAKACSIDLLPIQNLHGYDSPWVGGAGKNKLPKGTSSTTNGITYTVQDNGEVIVTGTATATAFWGVQFTILAGTYILNGCPSGGSMRNYIVDVRDKTGGSGIIGINADSGNGSQFTLTEPLTAYVNIRIANGYSAPSNGIKISPMIRLATVSDSTFAPYENNCPISGRNSVEVKRTGKNLLQNTATTTTINGVTFTVNADGSVRANGTASGNAILVLNSFAFDGTSVILSGCPSGGGGSTYRLDAFGSSGLSVDVGNGIAITTSGERNIRIVVFSGTTIDKVFYPMIRLPEFTDDTYEPYKGETYTEPLGATYYGGKVDFVSGEVVIDKEYRLLDETLNWQVNGTGTDHYFYYINLGSANYAIQGDIISDKFKTESVSQYNTGIGNVFCTPQYIRIRPFDTEVSVADWKVWLQSNNVQVAFGIQTPTALTLTPQEIELLKGTNVLWTDGDNVYIKWQNIPDIEVIKSYVDDAISTNITNVLNSSY